ncbi:hypothetical protein F4780DRAFT_186261 [Xylariomycetidae sp. FL0641]|nr:hypothetical protein F4780DRAFT_186261 [Xylariomycetidae sp. FL0641]
MSLPLRSLLACLIARDEGLAPMQPQVPGGAPLGVGEAASGEAGGTNPMGRIGRYVGDIMSHGHENVKSLLSFSLRWSLSARRRSGEASQPACACQVVCAPWMGWHGMAWDGGSGNGKQEASLPFLPSPRSLSSASTNRSAVCAIAACVRAGDSSPLPLPPLAIDYPSIAQTRPRAPTNQPTAHAQSVMRHGCLRGVTTRDRAGRNRVAPIPCRNVPWV